MTTNQIALSPSAINRFLIAIICLLVIAHIGVTLTKHLAGYETVYGIVPLFDLNSEHSVPAYFAATLLLFASVLVAVITVLKKHDRAAYTRQWTVLSGAFLYMAFDEAAGIHELLDRPTQELLGERASGMFHFSWVIPGMVVVLVFALWFLRFLLHLPRKTRLHVLIAAILFVGGAIGVELIEGRHAALHGSANLTFGMLVMVEETLEMAGVTVFIHAILEYIEGSYGEVRFLFRQFAESSTAEIVRSERPSAG